MLARTRKTFNRCILPSLPSSPLPPARPSPLACLLPTPQHTTYPGDSLTRLATTTLASVLRAKPIDIGLFGDEWEACGGELKVQFIRNDLLDVGTTPPLVIPNNAHWKLFAADEILREFDTLVVNSGAHPRPAAQFGQQMDAAAEVLTSSMNRLHGKNNAILVVRNTVPGHWGCTERWVRGVGWEGGKGQPSPHKSER